MPTFGLTAAMRGNAKLRPWGLDATLLQPAKVDTDPVHGDLYWLELERQIIDSEAMQRLRRVKQLGMTYKVYPSAEHSRFTHSLGTVRAAQDILDRAVEDRGDLRDVSTLFDEWRENTGPDDPPADLRLGEATILMRLAALLHDLCHIPFGHTIEDDLGVLEPHDRNQVRFARLWSTIPDSARVAIERAESVAQRPDRERSLFMELKRVVLDKVKPTEWLRGKAPGPSLYPFVGDIVNNTICADLVDYLRRDHLLTGLPMEIGSRFMDNFYVVRSDSNSLYAENLVVNAVRGGELRRDTMTELLKYLRYRYEITERALYHKTKLAYDAMLGKLLEMWKDQLFYELAIDDYAPVARWRDALEPATLRQKIHNSFADPPDGAAKVKELTGAASDKLEDLFLAFGDEGLLEHLIWELEQTERNPRQEGMRKLAVRIRDRDHFRMLGHFGGHDALPIAKKLHGRYGSADARRDLEQRAAAWAGVGDRWQVVLWIPPPEMRLKVAEVLVKNNRLIGPLDAMEPAAQGIVAQHRELWAMRVYAPEELRTGPKCLEILSFLRWTLGDLPIVETLEGQVVPLPWELAARRAGDELKLTQNEVRRVADEVHATRMGDAVTFAVLQKAANAKAKAVLDDRKG